MNQQLRTFTELIDAKIGQEKELIVDDIRSMVTDCTVDIICETAMGIKVDAQRADYTLGKMTIEQKYLLALRELFDLILKRIMTPWYGPEFIFRRLPDGKKFFKNIDTLHKFTNTVIQQRLKELKSNSKLTSQSVEDTIGSYKGRLAFLDLMLMYHLQDPMNFDLTSIREEVDTFMFGGHDTTSSALHFAFMLLGLNPDKQVCFKILYHGTTSLILAIGTQ